VGYEAENSEDLFNGDILSQQDLPVLAFMLSEKNLDGQAIPAAISVWIADDREVDVP
jgi:hypothetical protein